MGCKLNKNNRKDHLEKRKSQPRGKGYNLPIAHIVGPPIIELQIIEVILCWVALGEFPKKEVNDKACWKYPRYGYKDAGDIEESRGHQIPNSDSKF